MKALTCRYPDHVRCARQIAVERHQHLHVGFRVTDVVMAVVADLCVEPHALCAPNVTLVRSKALKQMSQTSRSILHDLRVDSLHLHSFVRQL